MERYKPYLNLEKIDTYEIKHRLTDAKVRNRILEEQKDLLPEDYKELGMLECFIESLNHLNNSRKENLKLYKVQMELDWSIGIICLYYNNQGRYDNRKHILGYINNNREFEKKHYSFGKLNVEWNLENGYVAKQYHVFDEIFRLSDTGVISYENKTTGIQKIIIDLKTVDFKN